MNHWWHLTAWVKETGDALTPRQMTSQRGWPFSSNDFLTCLVSHPRRPLLRLQWFLFCARKEALMTTTETGMRTNKKKVRPRRWTTRRRDQRRLEVRGRVTDQHSHQELESRKSNQSTSQSFPDFFSFLCVSDLFSWLLAFLFDPSFFLLICLAARNDKKSLPVRLTKTEKFL